MVVSRQLDVAWCNAAVGGNVKAHQFPSSHPDTLNISESLLTMAFKVISNKQTNALECNCDMFITIDCGLQEAYQAE